MANFHIKRDGSPGVCRARSGKCPLGSDADHYSTKEEARSAYEAHMESQLLNRFSAENYGDTEFKEQVARRRRVENAILNADPRKTVVQAKFNELPHNYEGKDRVGFFVHPEFRKALSNDEDFAAYVEIVQLGDRLSEREKSSAHTSYDSTSGLFIYSYVGDREDRDYDEE